MLPAIMQQGPGVRCQTKSSCFAVIVPQDATESLAARCFTGCASDFFTGVDQFVVKRLVIALCMIMGQKPCAARVQRSPAPPAGGQRSSGSDCSSSAGQQVPDASAGLFQESRW
jgi:hypothetical protein